MNTVIYHHPMDPYFKVLAKREKLMQPYPASFKPPSQAVILDEECVLKANEVFSSLHNYKQQLEFDFQRIKEDKQEKLVF